jgi:hypothetical protein
MQQMSSTYLISPDWIPAESVIKKVLIFHGALACALYPQQPAAALAVQGLFFFERNLNVKSKRLSSVKIPGPNEWPRCDELTWLQIRGFICSPIISSINPSQGAAKLSVKLPLPLTAIALLVKLLAGGTSDQRASSVEKVSRRLLTGFWENGGTGGRLREN